MRTAIFFIALMLANEGGIAQTRINKSFPVKEGQTISMNFDYPELIKITTWDKREISIEGSVSINNGENDQDFQLEIRENVNSVLVESQIPNFKKLPSRMMVLRDGKKMLFKNKEEYKKFKSEHGEGFNTMSWGPDLDIELEIKVPKNAELYVKSVYGMIEVKNFTGKLTAEATYGGIDAALVEKNTGTLKAETDFGQIYSNLDIAFSGSDFRDFHTEVSASPGVGSRYNFESKFGNVYLRKE